MRAETGSIRPARSGTGRGSALEGAARPRRDGEDPPGSTAILTVGSGEPETERVPGMGAGEQQPGGQQPNKQVRPLVAGESAEMPEVSRIDTPLIQVRHLYIQIYAHTLPNNYMNITWRVFCAITTSLPDGFIENPI